MIAFAAERFAAVVDELRPLGERHGNAMPVHGLALDIDWDFFLLACDAGRLITYTVRDAGKLIGYAVYFVGKNHHHKTLGWATSDVIWIEPERRRPRIGQRLLQFVESDLRERGAAVVQNLTSSGHGALGRLLESMGYEKVSVAYSKKLT